MSNFCPISQPLEIIHTLINKESKGDFSYKSIQKYFENEILTEDTVKLIPSEFIHNSLIKLEEVLVIQDYIEDEFYQPTIIGPNGVRFNSGLWTSSIYEGSEEDKRLEIPSNITNELQVRKRLLAVCKKTGKAFILAIYPNGQGEEEWEKWRQETFKMNSLHGIIGIFENYSGNEESDEEFDLPCIHLFKRFEHLIPNLISFNSKEELKNAKIKLISYLSECFGDDEKLLESILLLLVSKPSMRMDGLIDSLFIGKLTLNLCLEEAEGNADESIKNLKTILRQLKHFNANVKICDEGFDQPIYPKLNVNNGKIIPGSPLQQADGCLLLIDESDIIEVKVFKDESVKNLQSLINLISQQKLNYDFGMQEISLKTDMPILTLSRAKKSILPSDLCVKVKSIKFIQSNDFSLFKSYLEHVKTKLTYTLPEEMANYLEKDYLNLRKSSPILPNGNPKFNEQEFHRLMNLARLKSLTDGDEELTQETWESTKLLYL